MKHLPRLRRTIACAAALAFFAGCAAGPAASSRHYPPTDPKKILVLTSAPKSGYEELGRVGAAAIASVAGHQMNRLRQFNGDSGNATAIPESKFSTADVIDELCSEAADLGADAIILESQDVQVSRGMTLGPTNLSGTAIAIKFKPPPASP